MNKLDAVLAHIDQDIDQSVERLFSLLRIQSISTDPAYKEQCRAAADHVAAALTSIGFDTKVRPTAGHPAGGGVAHGGATDVSAAHAGHVEGACQHGSP